MTCCVFGVANHSPEVLVTALLGSSLHIQPSDIGILPETSKADTNFKYLLILSTSDLSRNLSRLSGSKSRAIVFSNPIDLMSFSGITYLDFSTEDNFTFQYTDLDMNAVQKTMPSSIVRKASSYLTRLIDNVKQGSLLNPLMTVIYSLPSQSQNVVKCLVIKHLAASTSTTRLSKCLLEHLPQRNVDRLLSIVDTEIGRFYSEAFGHIKQLRKRRQTVDLSSVAAATQTSTYELSYMLSVLDADNRKYTDSFDKARNRNRSGGLRT